MAHRCLQHLHLLALHLELLGYIPSLLHGLRYLRRICDFRGDSLTLRILRETSVLAAPWRLIDDAEDRFKGLNLTEGNTVLKLCMERGICTEDVECNLWGDTMTQNLFVILILVCGSW